MSSSTAENLLKIALLHVFYLQRRILPEDMSICCRFVDLDIVNFSTLVMNVIRGVRTNFGK